MLCVPGAISLDKKGNLFVSDHMIEISGNHRLLMYPPFPNDLSTMIFAPKATKEFPFQGDQKHLTFEPAFDSQNIMVVGYNPYYTDRFVKFYLDPTKINPDDPKDPTYAQPDGKLNDYYGWPVASTFDQDDNLLVFDANRGIVNI